MGAVTSTTFRAGAGASCGAGVAGVLVDASVWGAGNAGAWGAADAVGAEVAATTGRKLTPPFDRKFIVAGLERQLAHLRLGGGVEQFF